MAIGTTIDGLNTVTSLTAQDKVPVWDNEAPGEPTKNITAQNMANSVKSLASLPNTTEMNNAIAQSTANTAHFAVKNISSGETCYLNHTAIVMFFTDRGGMWTESSAGRTLSAIQDNSNIEVTRVTAYKIAIKNNYTYGVTIFAISTSSVLTFTDS